MRELGAAGDLSLVLGAGLALQGLAVIAWWALIWTVPGSGAWFVPPAWDPWPLGGFWLADFMALAMPSVVSALALVARLPGAQRWLWLTSGCWFYATLLCLEAALRLPGGWLGTALMATATGFTLGVAGTVKAGESRLFRVVPSRRGRLLTAAQTLAQIAFCWGLILGAWPLAIVEVQRRLPEAAGWLWLPRSGAMTGAGWALFAAGGALGLVSAFYMIRVGRGTPLPTACAGGLVIAGPYRVVRNPMAIAGIAQGIGVGLVLHSLPVVVYAVAGAMLWQFCLRPVEERDLLARHGASYEAYRRKVRCWWPALR